MSYVRATKTVNDVLTYVKRQFGDEAAIQITDADIIRWVNGGQEEIIRRTEAIKGSANADLVAGQLTYTFPTDILRLQAVLINNRPVKQVSAQEYEEYVLEHDPDNTASGQPLIWYEWANEFHFYPKPEYSAVGGIKIRYIKAPEPVVAANDTLTIPDAFYNRLIEYVLQQAYELDENFQASQLKESQFSTNLDANRDRDVTSDDTYPTISVREEDL